MRANDWFDECQGNFFAAGLTYYTIFALFPLLMVGFSVAGFLLSRRPDVLTAIDNKVRHAVPGALGQQMLDLMNSAIDARASVGVIGLAVAVWVGLNWMSNLRVALTELWRQTDGEHGYVRTKFSDLGAMVSSFVAIFATLALSALAGAAPMARLLRLLGLHELPVLDAILRIGFGAGVISVVVVGVRLDDRPAAEESGQLRQRRFGRRCSRLSASSCSRWSGRSI